jgi:hypothetical protein
MDDSLDHQSLFVSNKDLVFKYNLLLKKYNEFLKRGICFLVTRQNTKGSSNKKKKKKKRKIEEKKQKELLSRVEGSNCVHPYKMQKIIRRRGMVEQLSVRISFKFSIEVGTLISLPKSMTNNDITLPN